jgi:hypothetical protein
MKLKRNYRFVAYRDAPKGQAPSQHRRTNSDLVPSSPSVLAAANCNVRTPPRLFGGRQL